MLIYCMLFRLFSVLFTGWFAIGDEIVKGTRFARVTALAALQPPRCGDVAKGAEEVWSAECPKNS